jgi:hypothetical protein
MTKSPNYCLETDRQVNHCSGCENCCSQLSENKMPDILSMMGLYAAEAKTYYLYYQSWFHLEDSKK